MPNKYPNGRFPSNPDYALSFMQEVATNIAINSSAEVRTVNGPQGQENNLIKRYICSLRC